ncbi:MAG: MFS transporter [Sphingobacteriales bacterium]|nr:MAG: MFS transporter [Sphingobacteriales bacterium]
MSLNMQTTVISYMLFQSTRDELSLGMMGLAEVIPAVGFSLFSGHFVDQKEKRGLMRGCIFGYMVLSCYFIFLTLQSIQISITPQTLSWLIYAGVFAGGTLRAFVSPSNFALLGLIIPRKLYSNATTWSSTAWQLGAVTGPLIGGFLLAFTGYTASLATVLGIQVLTMAAITLVSKKEIINKAKEPILKSLREGLQFVFRSKVILAVLALDMFAVLFGGAIALLPVFATEILEVSATGYGWLRAAPGIGCIGTLFLLSFYPLKSAPGPKMLLSIAGFGLTMVVFGLSTVFFLSFLMLLLSGMFDAVSVVIRGTILQLYTPDEMRGRVAAVNTMFISSSNELGALESGITARLMGTVPAVVTGGLITIGIVVWTRIKAPFLKDLKLDPTLRDKT